MGPARTIQQTYIVQQYGTIQEIFTWSSWLSCFDVCVVSCNLKPLCMLFKRAIKIAQPFSY